MATTTVLEELSLQVQDELPRVVQESFPGLDPIYKYIENTAMNVESAETANMGYRWHVKHTYEGGLAGLIQSSNPEGPSIMDKAYMDGTAGEGPRFLSSSSAELTPFPSAVESPHAGVHTRTLALHMNTGNFSVPITWMQSDKLSATHIKQVAMDIAAIAKLRAYHEAVSFFNHNVAGLHVMGQITSIATYGTYSITVGIGKGRIGYFRPGMMIEIVNDTSGTPQFGTATDGTDRRNILYSTEAVIPVVVSKVDYLNKTITISPVGSGPILQVASAAGSNGTIVAIEVGDWIVWKGAYGASTAASYWPLVSWGLNDWIKGESTDYLFQTGPTAGGMYLGDYPHFASQVVAVGGALTDTVLNGYIGGFIEAYGDAAPDTILTTWGVTLKYIQSPNATGLDRMMFERTGKALDVKGGFSEVSFSFNGKDMRWLISNLVLPGYLYGLKLRGGNIKRYTPPKLGAGDSRIGNEVEFLADVGGGKGIFKIAHASDGSSMAMLEAPFWQYRLIAPVDVRSICLTGLTEATMI
jgi:hypothetical protein